MGSDRKGKSERDAILARRKLFVVTTLAGLAATECKNPFRPCLEIEPVDASGVNTAPTPCLSAPPQPCLSEPYIAPDAGEPAASDASKPTRDTSKSMGDAEPPRPRPCLTPMSPKDSGR